MNKQNPFRNITIFSFIVLFGMFVLSFYAWQQIPAGELVPINWGIDGQPNQYGSKSVGLLMLPFVSLGLVGLFLIIPKIEPRKANLIASQKAYQMLWGFMMLFFAGLHILLVFSTLGATLNVNFVISIGVGLLFMVIGNYMGKVQSNYMFGIRTPWTLASEQSWHKTHRLGGMLLFVSGILFCIMPFLIDSSLAILLIVGLVLVGVVVLTTYSYFVWKNDPNARESTQIG